MTLALFGGPRAVERSLPPYRSIGEGEVRAVERVARSGVLSGFYGNWGDEFRGGPAVHELETAWQTRFGVRHAVSVNSATSGLFAAMGAVGISPGDEVIVPPYTMSATAMAPLIYGGIPVFVDIEPETFCLDPEAVSRAITPRTRAIIAVSLFGHPARLDELRAIADGAGIYLVEDAAQAILAEEGGGLAGTVGHIGVFSLNHHKHIHCGEGGMCVTGDDRLADRLRLIRNHGECVAEAAGVEDLTNLVGFNYRMTELSAAVALEQLARVDEHVTRREAVGRRLSDGIDGLEGLTPPAVRAGCRHVYYVWVMKVDEGHLGISRSRFSEALEAEGFPHFAGYVAPLYRLPLFRRRIAVGRDGFPFTLTNRQYDDGLCPVAEVMHEREVIGFEPCAYDLTPRDLDDLVEAIRKVHAARHQLAASPTPAGAARR